MTHIEPPPAPPIYEAFRLMDHETLVRFLCRTFGYNRFSLVEKEYEEAHPETTRFIRRKLQPK